jgi:hypothetical protein
MTILSVLLTTLSALLGAWVGAHIALRRFKKERAFDKRLQWHDDVIQALYEASNTLSVAVHGTRNIINVNPTSVSKAWNEHHAALDGLAVLVWRGELYATRDGLRKLLLATGNISSLSRSMPWRMNPSEFTEQDLQKWDQIAAFYLEAAKSLASDVRKHLGLELVSTN